MPQYAGDMDFGNKYGIVWRRFLFSNEVNFPARQVGYSSHWTTNWFIPTQYVADLVTNDFWGFNGVARYGPELLKQPRLFGVREYSERNEQLMRPRHSTSSDMEPREGGGPHGLDPQVVRIRECTLEENWDLGGDVVLSEILATLKVERRVRDLDVDIIMRGVSDSPTPFPAFSWTSSAAYGKKRVPQVNGELGDPTSCTEVR